jgi:hypothetical protein
MSRQTAHQYQISDMDKSIARLQQLINELLDYVAC